MPKPIQNFGRTWSFVPKKIATPATVDELAQLIKDNPKLRPMGSKHSWSQGIVTDETLVSLEKLNQILEIDIENKKVKTRAGIILKNLIVALEQKGLAMANLGSIHAQTLAGAICTGTHGTGKNFQCLAAQVHSFEMLDGLGQNHLFEKSNPDFYALLTGMGSCGIIHTITLDVVNCFQMHAITDTAGFDEVIENIEQYTSGYDHFKFWWLAPSQKVILFKNNRTDAKRNDSNFKRFIQDDLISEWMYRFLVWVGKLNRKKFIPAINRFLTKAGGKYNERISKSVVGFLTPLPPVHRETEWAFDAKDARRLLQEYKNLLQQSGGYYNFVQEVRFTKADDFWLSPAYKRDSIWLSMYNMDCKENWEQQLGHFETWAMQNGGRPHWGKDANWDKAYLEKQYEKFADFKSLIKKYDPQQKFLNKWNTFFCE